MKSLRLLALLWLLPGLAFGITPTQKTTGAGATPSLTGVTANSTLILEVDYSYFTSSTYPTPICTDSQSQTVISDKVPTPSFETLTVGNTVGIAFFRIANANAGTHTETCSITGPISVNGIQSSLQEWPATLTFDQFSIGADGGNGITSFSTGNSGTTSQATELVIAGLSVLSGAGATNAGITDPPSGYTSIEANQNTAADVGMEFAYKNVSSTGAQSAAWTMTDITELTSQSGVVTYELSGGGGGGNGSMLFVFP